MQEIFNLIKEHKFKQLFNFIKENNITDLDIKDDNNIYFINHIINNNQYELLKNIINIENINLRSLIKLNISCI